MPRADCMSYTVEINSTFETEDGEDCMTVCCPAQYRFSTDRRVFRYDEYGEDDAVMHVRVVSSADGVDIIREGNSALNLKLRVGQSFSQTYETQFGLFMLEYTAEQIDDGLTADGGTLTVRYRIDIGGVPSLNTVQMTVKKHD